MRRAIIAFVPLILAVPVHAAEPSPADYLAVTLQQYQTLTDSVVGPITRHPWLSEADKDLMQKALKPMQDAVAALKEKAKDNPTMEIIQAEQPKIVQSSQQVIALLNTRSDLKWISDRGKAINDLKTAMMRDKPNDFVAILKTTGAGESDLGKAIAAVNDFAAQAAGITKDIAIAEQNRDAILKMKHTAAMAQKSAATLATIDGLLTIEQRFEIDWGVAKTADDAQFRILGYAAQPGTNRAPADGTYSLKSGDSRAQAIEIGTVTLKKGVPIGFRKTDKGTMAPAGDKTLYVPPNQETRSWWEFVPAK